MPVVEIICLANSLKHQGRCVAGLRMDGGGWIRPVSPGDGTLWQHQYTLPDGSEARPLDLLRVEVGRARPVAHQPENWTLGDRPWELAGRPTPAAADEVMAANLVRDGALFGDSRSRIPFTEFARRPAPASLALAVPANIRWVARTTGDARQARTQFTLGGNDYDLSVTDPLWRQRMERLPDGSHSWKALGFPEQQRAMLTLSLGEPYEGHCYKLVAAVMPINEELAVRLLGNRGG
ncbi:MAG: hypothetical protein GEU28_05240 [Dehalococcoidia bacterium]|nr:hypothetical protein [Dehalococcoidia bacterium]